MPEHNHSCYAYCINGSVVCVNGWHPKLTSPALCAESGAERCLPTCFKTSQHVKTSTHTASLFQTNPTRCTLLLGIFISTSQHVSGNYVFIIRRTYCICATLVFFTLYRWLSDQQTRQPPIQSKKYQCRTDTVSSPNDEHIVARNM